LRRVYNIFRIFENILNDVDSYSNLLKGQVLMSMTTIIIVINAKEEFTNIFLNFINNILIELIKNTNNYINIYLRQIACYCLEELETEYPCILFSLMGRKTIDLLEIGGLYDIDEKASQKSKFTGRTNASKVPELDKKVELGSKCFIETLDYGIYNLIDEEKYYVFQYYLSLYTTILKNLLGFVKNFDDNF
jgi:hypothetical protein